METSRSDLIGEIVEFCNKNRIDESADFVTFLVSLVSLDSTIGNDESLGYREKTIEAVKNKLLNRSEPSFLTLKIQFYFSKYYRDRDSIITKNRSIITTKTAPLIEEICEINKLNSPREIERLYQKMLVVITVLSGLGNPTIPTILREVAIALQSVLQPSELPRYVTLPQKMKEEQLIELVSIVAGIRLFNRDCQRGGEGIDDLPSILQAGMNRTRSTVIQMLESLMKKVYKFTAVVEAPIRGDSQKKQKSPVLKDIMWCTDMLVATRQQEIYVRKLLSDLEICEEEIRRLINRLQTRLAQLHETVKFRTAVPTSQVYPQFIELAEIWLKLQDEVIVLSFITEILHQLWEIFPENTDSEDQNIIDKTMWGDIEILTDAERLEKTMGQLIVECAGCSIAYPNNDTNFDKLNLQFLGFCAWSFVVGDGALIPGNPNIGVADWNGKCFAFSSIEAARHFGKYPERFLYLALDIIRKRPAYIHLFQLFNDIEIITRRARLPGQYMPLTIRQDQEVQTVRHVLPTFIDHDYSSSLWEYRKRALQLANLCRCVTRSTQTMKSHFRAGVCLQSLMPKEKEVQTRREISTNTHKSKKYITGLRGRQNNVQVVDCSFHK